MPAKRKSNAAAAMTVVDAVTTQLRECEDKLLNIKEYKKDELRDLYRVAEEAIQALKAEQDAIESALPQLADNERQRALGRKTQMGSMETSATAVQSKLEILHAHTGELCTILEPQTTRLKHLQTKIQYFELVLQVETLSTRAKTSADSNGDIDALVGLAALNQSLAAHFGMDVSLQLNLRSLIKQRMVFLAVELQTFHSNALDAALRDVNWPQFLAEADFVSKAAELTAVREKFTTLVQVQLALASVSPDGVESEMSELWAMHRLLQSLIRRFHFHFDTDVKTNDVTKPEWYLTHVLETLRGHAEFLHSVVRPALARGLESSQAAPHHSKTDGLALFIHGLLQPVRAKLKQTMPILLLNKPLLCHTIDEVVDFEWKLRDEFQYRAPRVPNQKYRHVLDEVASNPRALDLWLQIDAEYAQNFTQTFLRDDAAWTEMADTDNVTHAAYAIAATLDVLTKRFQVLTDPAHRYAYVAQVLKPWLYQCYLAIERYGRAQHISQTRLVEATKTNDMPPGLRGCSAAINTAWFVHELLKELDEAKVFVELLPIAKVTLHQSSVVPLKLKQKVVGLSKTVLNPLLETQEAKNVTHALLGQGSLVLPTAAFSAAYSVGSTLFRSLQGPTVAPPATESATADPDPSDDDDEVAAYTLEGSMFENEWTWFQGGVQALEEALVQASFGAIRAMLGQYHLSPRWTEPAAVDRIALDVSPELGAALALLHQHLGFTHASLNPSSFEAFWKALAKEVDGHLVSIVLRLKGMSKNGRLQFSHDVNAVAQLLRPHTGRPDAYVRRLREASAVLNMPSAKAAVLLDALSTQHEQDMASDQVKSMLEASQIHALTPAHVSTLLRIP